MYRTGSGHKVRVTERCTSALCASSYLSETMDRHKDTKMRESDRENRLTGRWTAGIGFVIVLIGALFALFLLMGSG